MLHRPKAKCYFSDHWHLLYNLQHFLGRSTPLEVKDFWAAAKQNVKSINPQTQFRAITVHIDIFFKKEKEILCLCHAVTTCYCYRCGLYPDAVQG